jgi:phosphatidylglycerol:prolipoprotein diacylglycerol transferase
MLMLAFVVGIAVAMRRAGRYRVDPLYVIDFALFVLAGSILGSRGLYIWLNWGDEYAQDPSSVLNVWEGGLAFHGGLIGGVLGAMLFCRWRQIRLSVVADLTAPSVAFGYAIARVGCFLNGCCHGGPTTVPWGVDFPLDDIPTPVHPVQLYAGLGSLILGVILLGLTRVVRVPGHLILWYLVLYSALRSFMEHFRRGFTAEPLSIWPALTQAQAASILVAVAALAVIIATRTRTGYPLPEPDPPDPEQRAESHRDRKSRKKRRKPRS